jgi:hypothetical protein
LSDLREKRIAELLHEYHCLPDASYRPIVGALEDLIEAELAQATADIAAKAKEWDTSAARWFAAHLPAAFDADDPCGCPLCKTARERDAKIRREVFDLLDAAIPEDADETHPVAVIYQLLAARGMKLPRKVICHRCGRDCRWGYGKIAALRFCLPCTSGFMAWWEGKRAAPKPEGPQ